jgi:hypothetical protein
MKPTIGRRYFCTRISEGGLVARLHPQHHVDVGNGLAELASAIGADEGAGAAIGQAATRRPRPSIPRSSISRPSIPRSMATLLTSVETPA